MTRYIINTTVRYPFFRSSKEIFTPAVGWLIICSLLLICFSCTKDTNFEPGPGLLDKYYPLETGDVRTYTVDSITYDYDGDLQRIVIDTVQYFLKELVLQKIDSNGDSWYRIGQLRSEQMEGPYQLTDYVYEKKTREQLLRKEGNLTFIPLSSPLNEYEEWDGTAYFDASKITKFIQGEIIQPYEGWKYIYLNKWDQYEVLNYTYDEVIQINQRDTLSIPSANDNGDISPEKQLFYYLANEFYAPQTGLIEKEEYHLISICASANAGDFRNFCDSTTIFQNAERGYIYHKKLISFE